nr:FAD-dependent oxidoreductase [Odoribacter splanchnicus]
MKILEKAYIGKVEIKNRIVMAPMNVGALNNSDGTFSERAIEYFTERARGGVGLIITGSVRVTREFERSKETIPLWMPFADHKIHIGSITELVERCHDYGAKVAIQLSPGGGRQAGSYAQIHGLAIGPSEIDCFYPPHYKTRALTKEDIQKFLDAFCFAASIVKTAGADAIQLHGHEGYLLDQFSTALWNRRTDEYGGSLSNRLRFAKELIEAVKDGAGTDFPVIYRYGLSHFIPGGRTIEEGIEMAKLLESYGADALDIDAGCYDSWYLPHPPGTIKAGAFAYLAEKVKKVVRIPVITSGKISYPEIAEQVLEKDSADFISLGRPLIADPYWVRKVEENRTDEIRPCIGCHEGCLRRLMDFKSLSCAVNPTAGNERYLAIEKTSDPKHILVVGGGVAGMVAACVASRRGHRVTLIEKTSELGGNFTPRLLPDFKYDYNKYIDYLKRQLEKWKIQVQYNQPFSPVVLEKINPDWLIWAAGATFKIPDIPGVTGIKKTDPLECYKQKKFDGIYTIIGGGLVGTEAALNIARHGGKVFLIENQDKIAKDAYKANRDHLLLLLEEAGVEVYTEMNVEEIEDRIIRCRNKSGNRIEFKTDHVVFCIGMLPNKDIPAQISTHIKTLNLGDALHPGRVIDAVWEAYRKIRLI